MFIRYPDAFICRVSGKHAAQYLQNRLSNDIRALTPGSGVCEAAALTPQGRVAAVFAVAALASDTFLLCTDGGPKGEALKALAQFKVAERVDFADQSESHALIHLDGLSSEQLGTVFQDISAAPAPGRFLTLGENTMLSIPRFSPSGIHAVVSKTEFEKKIPALASISSELLGDPLTVARVQNNLPSFPEELNDQLLLSEANRADLVSFTKGCYVGQEVVAKIDALGRAPRVLVRFASGSKEGPKTGATIVADGDASGRSLGKILTVAFDSSTERNVGFAVIRSDQAAAQDTFQAEGLAITLLR